MQLGLLTGNLRQRAIKSVNSIALSTLESRIINGTRFLFYKKPSSMPSTKSFLIFGYILFLKVSYKFLNLEDCIENDKKHVDIANY